MVENGLDTRINILYVVFYLVKRINYIYLNVIS